LGLGGLPLATVAGVLAVGFLCAQVMLQRGWLLSGPANDFLTFYSAAGASDIYSAAAVEAARPAGMEGVAASSRPYLRPPFHAVLFRPLAWLPYATAYQVFLVLMVWCIAGFILWWRPPTPIHTLLFTVISIPLFFALIRGQDLPVVLLAVAACARSVRANRPFQAGAWLSLAAIQPVSLLAAPLVILAQRRWRLAVGLASGLAALAAISFVSGGLDWPQRFAAAWTDASNAITPATPNLAGAAAWLGLDAVAAAVAAIAVAALVFIIGRRESFAASMACALAAGALIAPNVHLEDTVLLLPAALALLAETSSWMIRFCAAILLTPIGFVLQGREEPIPVLVFLGVLVLVLAAVLPSREQATRRRQLVQLGLS
jgi:hypothetical protein